MKGVVIVDKKRAFVYGSGGHARVITEILILSGVEVVALLDDDESRVGIHVMSCPIVRADVALDTLIDQGIEYGIVGIGDNRIREEKAALVRQSGYRLIGAVHPTAVISSTAELEPGTAVMAKAVVNPGARVGENCILNTGCIVDHDCLIGLNVHLSPGVNLGGNVTIGDRTHIGIGASVLNNIAIGSDVVVGGGAVVIRDLPDGVTAVGVPAKIIKPT